MKECQNPIHAFLGAKAPLGLAHVKEIKKLIKKFQNKWILLELNDTLYLMLDILYLICTVAAKKKATLKYVTFDPKS